MSLRRQTIARRLLEAQHTAAMLTTFNEVDMSAVMALRARRKESFKAKYGVSLGLMLVLRQGGGRRAQGVPAPQRRNPGRTRSCSSTTTTSALPSARPRGWSCPSCATPSACALPQIERAIRDFAAQAKDGKLTLDDLRGGTFTITNGGVFGSLLSTPILNPPQVGILGMHTIKDRPVVVDGEIACAR